MWTNRFLSSLRTVIRQNGSIRENTVCRHFSRAMFSENICAVKTTTTTTMIGGSNCRGIRKSVKADADPAARGDRNELGLDENDIDDEWIAPQTQSIKPKNKKAHGTLPRETKKPYQAQQHKSPKRAVEMDDDDENDSDDNEKRPSKKPFKKRTKDGQDRSEPKSYRKVFNDNSLRVFDAELNLSYTKLRYDNPELQAFMLMTKSKKFRIQNHLLMIEGRRLLLDALDAGLPLKYILFSRHDQLAKIKEKLHEYDAKPEIIRVPHHDLSFWSVMTTCPGIIGLFNKPIDMNDIYKRLAKPSSLTADDLAVNIDVEENLVAPANAVLPPITVILDQIRDPSNLGGIIRTCAAIPCHQVLLTKGCADPWDTKALRGGAGGQFRIPIRGPMAWDSIHSILPQSGEYSFFIADNNWRPKKAQTLEEELEADDEDDGKERNFVTTLPYSSVSFADCQHAVLVVGGETEGISRDAYKLLREQRGQWNQIGCGHHALQIPLANGVESLNTNAAASILLFEIRKQMQAEKLEI